MALNRSESARTPLVHLWNGVGDNSSSSSPLAMTVRPTRIGSSEPLGPYRQKSLNLSGAGSV
jgi:hypothetical protein